MELTYEQVEHLFEFTEKKGVRWYDLQSELVDHLATRIEDEMNADATLTFEVALEKVYRSFGIFGFARIVQEKQNQLMNAARKRWWKEVGAFFRWPKIGLLALIITLSWQLALYINPGYLVVGCIWVYVTANVFLLVKSIKARKTKKKLLLLQFGPWHFSGLVFFYESAVLFNFGEYHPVQFTIFATMGILIQAASVQLYLGIKKQAAELYPEAFA